MAAVKQQKHLSGSFTIKTKNYSSRVPTSIVKTVQFAKT